METPIAPAELEKGVLRAQWIGPESEEALLKAGLLGLGEAVGTGQLLDFPRRANGTPLLTRQGFFERLLKGETSFLDCAAADASAAEADVKRLALHQLLAIRGRNLDFNASAAKGQGAKASFLSLVDRCTMVQLGHRLLGAEVEALSDAHRALVLRHVVLIYGAARTLAGDALKTDWSDWWLLAVGGTRRYLQLSACEVRSHAPGTLVCCYRSYTAPKPQDPKRSRIFRWQVLLVQNPVEWMEDPLATEQRAKQRKSLTDAAASPKKGSDSKVFELFGDFDVDALFEDLEEVPQSKTPEAAGAGGAAMAPEGDIDDFFDSLLADPFFESKGSNEPALQPQEASEPATSPVPNGSLAEGEAPSMRSQARLRLALTKFYASRKSDKLGNLDKIVERYVDGRVVELWASLGSKYNLPPSSAVQWLASTLDSRVAVQWPADAVPEVAQRALDELGEDPDEACVASCLRSAMKDGDLRVSAMVFIHGCTESQRPALWRTLLGPGRTAEDQQTLRERRLAYEELKARMLSEMKSEECAPESPPSKLKEIKQEVALEAQSSWRGEAFFTHEVTEAMTMVALVHGWRAGRCVNGVCELAGLLLYGLSGVLKEAEADAFWCLSQLLAETQETILGDDALALQARRVHELHRLFDPPVADLLQSHGLSAMPALRLGGLLLTRAGFSLQHAARLWDSLLADPRRFEFADHLVIALLLHCRGDLLQRDDVGGLAETLLAAPGAVDFSALLRTAYAVCALQRRHGANSTLPFPKPREVTLDLDSAVAAAQEGLSSLWGKVRAAGQGYWEAADWEAQVARAQQLAEKAKAAVAEAAGSAASALEAKAQAAEKEAEAAKAAKAAREAEEKAKEKARLAEASKAEEAQAEVVHFEAEAPTLVPPLVAMPGEPPKLVEAPLLVPMPEKEAL